MSARPSDTAEPQSLEPVASGEEEETSENIFNWFGRHALILILMLTLLRGLVFAFAAFPLVHHDEPSNFAYVTHFLYHNHYPVAHYPGIPPYNPSYPADQAEPAAVAMILSLPHADPVKDPDHQPFLNYEFNQAPLYYVVPGIILRPFRDNLFFVMYATRVYSVLLNVLTIFFAYRCFLLIFPTRRNLVITATLFMAMIPGFGYDGASINTSGMINLLYVLLFYVLLMIVRHPKFDRYGLWLGLVTGLGVLTKVTIVVGLLTTFSVLGYLFLRRSRREAIYRCPGWLGLSILLSGWLYVRNYIIYGDLWGFSENFAYYRKIARHLTISDFPIWFISTLITFWIDFQTNVLSPLLTLFPVFFLFLLIAMVASFFGLGRFAFRIIREERQKYLSLQNGAVLLLLLGNSLFTLGTIVPYNFTVDYEAQGRYFYSALIPISAGFVAGLYLVTKKEEMQKYILNTLSIVMILFTVWACVYLVSINI